jgi:4-amino-4-deoxy-L-arabinose transferase-like glycosyltransferase
MRRLPSPPLSGSEWLPVTVLTVIAAVVRLAGFGRLGLDHFDEGIYASTALGMLGPAGLAGIDPGLIPYSPPGYPVLVGLAYRLLGPSDRAAIAISILAGIAAVPIVAWLGRRAFGPGYGVAAAAFAAVSMPHVTFSRMALTDATFLLAWLVAIGAGGRFLEKPGPTRALVLGLAVGLAQLVKYNGWLAGAIVLATALLGAVISPEDRSRGRLARTFGWGTLAALIALLVDWPWIRFVEARGGYASLIEHQRGYFDGPSAWPSNWLLQLRQLVALHSSIGEALPGPLLAILGLFGMSFLSGRHQRRSSLAHVAIVLGIFALSRASIYWWLGAGLALFLLGDERPAVRLFGVWWIALTILTPMYHPYARLWLPLEASGWIMAGLVVAWLFGWGGEWPGWDGLREHRARIASTALAVLASWLVPSMIPPRARPLPGGIPESRTLRAAAHQVVASLPAEVTSVRVLGRPPLLFYLAPDLARRGVILERLASSDDLLSAPSEGWAVVDAALLRQEGERLRRLERLLPKWEVVAGVPSTLSPATLLDVDPRAAVGDLSAREEPLYLLRPRRNP